MRYIIFTNTELSAKFRSVKGQFKRFDLPLFYTRARLRAFTPLRRGKSAKGLSPKPPRKLYVLQSSVIALRGQGLGYQSDCNSLELQNIFKGFR